MLEINSLDDIRGNNVVIYSIKSLMEKKVFPHFVILAGHMGVGKSSVAKLVADQLNKAEQPVTTFNFGLKIDMKELEDTVFKMNPSQPRAFVFEELHGLDKSQQTALLTMLDSQPVNIYVICTTTEIHRILQTIRSRATVWNFRLLGQKQLAQLLDDYLVGQATKLTQKARNALLRSCFGVPRDLLKNADLAISGEFNGTQLEELLGRVSEDLIFSLLCSLKTTSVDFASNLASLMEEAGADKLVQLRDFYTRFLLERKGIEGATISSDKITTLEGLYTPEELEEIGRTLVRTKPETLALELSLLNMKLTKTSNKSLVGQQIDKAATHQATGSVTHRSADVQARINEARLNPAGLRTLKLGDS